MLRSQPEVIAYLDTTGTDLQRVTRHPVFSAKRLDRTLKALQRSGNAVELGDVAVTLRHSAPVADLERAFALPLVQRPGNGRTMAVPRLAALRRFPVASIDLSRRDIALPFGVGRYMNAATLKRVAGGRRSDRLLKKTASGWEFMENDAMIDLTDASQEYRLGRLTIFS